MKGKLLIEEVKDKNEMLSFHSLIKQLNPKLKKVEYKVMLDDMLAHGYRMAAVYDGEKCAGLSGFWIATKIYSGKYVELDNVVIDKNYRNKGIGKKLCDWILKEAKKQGCVTAMLDAYAENIPAHRFYYREGFYVRGFHFLKQLN
jgi:GNAT superfamily N-acetyltransferase